MRFLLDHDVPDDIAYTLEALDHQVLRLRDLVQATAADDQVWRLAADHDCVLITCNRDDFLALAAGSGHRRARRHPGATLRPAPPQGDAEKVKKALTSFQ